LRRRSYSFPHASFARAVILLSKCYATFDALGASFLTGPGNSFGAVNSQPEQFRASVAPLGEWVGVADRVAEGGRNGQNART
jgi:hypothetical protein